LDSKAGWTINDVEVENVIYDVTATPPTGTYRVRVDDYEHCNLTTSVPFEVIVRTCGVETGYCGLFPPSTARQGDVGAGRSITAAKQTRPMSGKILCRPMSSASGTRFSATYAPTSRAFDQPSRRRLSTSGRAMKSTIAARSATCRKNVYDAWYANDVAPTAI